MTTNRKLIVGNWKMNGTGQAALTLVMDIVTGAAGCSADMVICPPFTLLSRVGDLITGPGQGVALGAQDCHPETKGAFTGDISAEMLTEFGTQYVIVGHSERRAQHGETSPLVAKKAAAVLRAGLVPIICVGETSAIRETGHAEDVVAAELEQSLPEITARQRIVVAYEPIWAIGTGKSCGANEIKAMHARLRQTLEARGLGNTPILYGGSVKADNAAEILTLPHVDGALVGGASLEAAGFLRIASAV